MQEIKIILYLCNWGPHVAFQTLQDQDYLIPPEVKMVRIPCTGRISKALLFKAFEMGADGVALVGCQTGTCRYGRGTDNAAANTEDTRGILDLLGLGKERLRFAAFLPEDVEALKTFLFQFRDDLRRMTASPIRPGGATAAAPRPGKALAAILAEHHVSACQDCGKCTSACPLALSGKPYSPRGIVNSIITGKLATEAVIKEIWSCLTCGICFQRCPSQVDFPAFIRDLRAHVAGHDNGRGPAHGGFFQSLMRAMTAGGLQPQRWLDLPQDIEVNPHSKTLFFGGCAPYFDVFFRRHQTVKTAAVLTDSLRLLNFFDVKPALLSAEKCCGHDLLWSGDEANFLRLARLNTEMIRALGITEVITACPECYQTMAHDYAAHGIETGFNVKHIYEFLEHEIDKNAVAFKPFAGRLTYQDACRLNRSEHMRAFPRKLLQRLRPEGFSEMKESQNAALCCGNSAWTGCDAYSKALQVKRIRQAKETGSNLLLTSCPKCQIHLRCAMEDPFRGDELRMEMKDLTSVIAETICWE